MAQLSQHPQKCENATRNTCRCTYCSGGKHGWVGALRLARGADDEALRTLERDADERWRKECAKQEAKRQQNPRPNLQHKSAAVDKARIALINWLNRALRSAQQRFSGADTSEPDHQPPATGSPAHDPTAPAPDRDGPDRALATALSVTDEVQALGDMLDQALNDIEEEIGHLSPDTRRRMAHHFWCDLLAQLVVVIEESDRLLDSVPETVANAVAKSRRANEFGQVQHKVVLAGARQLWKQLTSALGLTAISDAKPLLPALRALAVFACKSPPHHSAVTVHCLGPLRAHLPREALERLSRVFGDLLPDSDANVGDGPLPETA